MKNKPHSIDPVLSCLLKTVGKRLKRARQLRDEKHESVAISTGIDQSIISRIENGIYYCLSLEMLLKLVTYYEINIREVFD